MAIKRFLKQIRIILFFGEIHNIILKHIGLDKVIINVIERLGDVKEVYLAGSFSRGLDSQIIDLILIGNIDINYLVSLIGKVEKIIHRKIRYLIYSPLERDSIDWSTFSPKPLMLWDDEKNKVEQHEHVQ